jgi:hypothetical protein
MDIALSICGIDRGMMRIRWMAAGQAGFLSLFRNRLHADTAAVKFLGRQCSEVRLLSATQAAKYRAASRRSSAVEQLIRNQ